MIDFWAPRLLVPDKGVPNLDEFSALPLPHICFRRLCCISPQIFWHILTKNNPIVPYLGTMCTGVQQQRAYKKGPVCRSCNLLWLSLGHTCSIAKAESVKERIRGHIEIFFPFFGWILCLFGWILCLSFSLLLLFNSPPTRSSSDNLLTENGSSCSQKCSACLDKAFHPFLQSDHF